MHSRRSLIFAAGGASVAALGGLGAYRVTRKPQTALLPWTKSDAIPVDVRLDAIRHAILAPNPHNRQPWMVKFDGADALIVSCDLNRRLPETDPFDRQILIGFGCFFEIARMAAAERGYRMTVEPFPNGQPGARLDSQPIARLRFILDSAVQRDPLFESVFLRHTNRAEFDVVRGVAAKPLAQLRDLASSGATVKTENEPSRVQIIRNLAVAAFIKELDISRTYMESARLIRIGSKEIDANPDGISLGGPLFETLLATGQISHAAVEDTNSAAFKQGREPQIAPYRSAPAYIWITTPANTREAQLETGRVYVRVNLAATRMGLSMHPASQALQEYPEMTEAFTKMHSLLGAQNGMRVQMLARIGYGSAAAPSPRWPAQSHIIP
jgi:nitroreductase